MLGHSYRMPGRRLHILLSRCGVGHSIRNRTWLLANHHSSSDIQCRWCPDLPAGTSERAAWWRWRVYVCVVPPWTLLSRWNTHSLPAEHMAQSRYRHNGAEAEQSQQLHILPGLRSALHHWRPSCGSVRLLDGEPKRIKCVPLPVASRMRGRSCSLCRRVVCKRPQRCSLWSMRRQLLPRTPPVPAVFRI